MRPPMAPISDEQHDFFVAASELPTSCVITIQGRTSTP
ncbi:MAG: hypothetical protein AVDCRST_MAG93-650 [uncultured Chloroflexia bacterium]|uniref:Uncharacterized protein n=1 Tax=uncultured Chloroflexia bacterium TaxID=1672391 RepID=A0A6J4HLM0_9CHLR|nr:MAG: hypothetical protein AVDCRST_MAG93-650 [uncultured Chloroflexia bacterium]